MSKHNDISFVSQCREAKSDQLTRKSQSSIESSDVKGGRVQALIHGLEIVLRHHGCPSKTLESFNKQAREYLLVDREEVFLKRAKYLILCPMAQFLENELPVSPDLAFVSSGKWRRWSNKRLHCYSRKNSHLWFSFLQGKRAAERVSDEIVLSNFIKHRNQMLSPDPLVEAGVEGEQMEGDLMDVLSPLLARVEKVLFSRLLSFFRNPEKEIHQASQHASLEASRGHGGQVGALKELIAWQPSVSWGDLSAMSDRPGLHIQNNKLVANPVLEVRTSHNVQELEYALAQGIRNFADQDHLTARVEGVLEPFKVRTISKGPAIPYYLAKPVQKALHTVLRKIPCFRLIGKPVCASDLMDLLITSNRADGRDGRRWLSIDYSAATDGLSASLSARIMEALLSRLAFENVILYRLLLKVLAPHVVTYPCVNGVRLEPVLQQNGQLMGSVLSFPILCIANLALYLLVCKETRPDAKYKDLLDSVLINGDDMLYIGTAQEWELHKQLGKRMGLEMSPGKAYIHHRYANINSVSFDCDLTISGSVPVRNDFLNVGLLLGNHKVLAKVGSDSDNELKSPYCSVINQVVTGAWNNPGKVLSQYISLHGEDMSKESRGRNWFLPISVGGMGGTPPLGFDFHVTDYQRLIAAGLRIDHPYLVPSIRPMEEGFAPSEVMDQLIDPLSSAMLLEEDYRKYKKGSQTLSLGLRFGWTPYIFSEPKSSLDPRSTGSVDN